MKPRDFFAELQRRNVLRAAAFYAASAWLLVQVATQVFPFFHISEWVVRWIVVAAAIGFPIAMLFSWFYEWTPQGLQRESEIQPGESITRHTGKRLDRWIIAILALAVVLLLTDKFVLRKDAETATAPAVPEKSIAVLPFENLSSDKENAYLVEGIQDEILTRLSKIADLKVISRTSTQHYKSRPENLPEIARQLGVAHILEGSVQKSGDTIRVNVQLIKAVSDSHLWADTFDRKLIDTFSVESEVARSIADQLQAKLTGKEVQVISAQSTHNPNAYDAYLHGLSYAQRPADTYDSSLGAQKYFREAVRLDPKFALGWAWLSWVETSAYITGTLERSAALTEEARQTAETALILEPNLGEGMVAKGYYHYGCLKDYDTAVRYFERARQVLPNSSRIPESLAYVARRRGQWEQAETYFSEAERLDPRNAALLTQHAFLYSQVRRLPEAERKLDQILEITPNDLTITAKKASIAQAKGDLPRAAAILGPLDPSGGYAQSVDIYQAILERQPARIIPRLKELLSKHDPNGYQLFWLGWAQEVAGEKAASRETWQQARSLLERGLNKEPDDDETISFLALICMELGDKAAAFELVERAMTLVPIEKDAVNGPTVVEVLARVAAGTGEPDRAITALEKVLSVPCLGALTQTLTPALVRLDPMFDSLHNDPRFQKLCEEKKP